MLGIGGVRALRALDLHPQVFHTNEGHAGFLGLERVREWTEQGLSFAEAIEAVRAGGVFTTHTPVPAGIDRFPRELFEPYFDDVRRRVRGRRSTSCSNSGQRADEPDGKFNMAVMGLRLAARSNGVARLHGDVSREMFGGMWPDLPAVERADRSRHQRRPRPHVGSATASTSCSPRRSASTGHLAAADDWARVHHVDRSRDLGHPQRRPAGTRRDGPRPARPRPARPGRVDDRLRPSLRHVQALDAPARASSTGCKALLLDADRPVQFVFAGKAHPADQPGKALIQEIHHLASETDVRHRFVFIPDYDIGIARTMYHGCDVWLNTPRRPMEACGTSGMKAALNGVLNCSILDGWWDEMTDGTNGFDIPSFDMTDDDSPAATTARRTRRST